jgi:hypothetical protein
MRNSFWACLIAIAVGGISLLIKAALPEQHWLAPALFYLTIVIALLATLGLVHDFGLFSRVAANRARRVPGRIRLTAKLLQTQQHVSKYPDLRAQLAQYRCCRSSPRVRPAIPPQRCEEKTRKAAQCGMISG